MRAMDENVPELHHRDAALIDALGGPAELARRLGFDPAKGGVQRVHNWRRRGIPVALRYQRQDIFGPADAQGAEAIHAA